MIPVGCSDIGAAVFNPRYGSGGTWRAEGRWSHDERKSHDIQGSHKHSGDREQTESPQMPCSFHAVPAKSHKKWTGDPQIPVKIQAIQGEPKQSDFPVLSLTVSHSNPDQSD